VALLALVTLSGIQCMQDLLVSPPKGDFALIAVSPQSDTVSIGDTLPPLSVRLTLNGNAVDAAFRFELASGGSAVSVDSTGRLAVIGPGNAVVRARPVSIALPVDTLRLDFNLHAAVPTLARTGQDSIFSLKDTLALTVEPRSTKGAAVSGVAVRWQVVSGSDFITLLDSTSATVHVRAEANGDVVLRALTDTATKTDTVHVRQRAASLIPPGAIVLRAVGRTHQLNPVVRDARLSAVVGAILSYTSRAPAFATVTSGGLVTAVADGTTRIVQTALGPGGGSASDSTTVVVQRAHLGVVSGGGQSASIGHALAQPLVVQLLDPSNEAVAESGLRIVFRVTSGDARFAGVDSLVAYSDAEGRASAVLTLGTALAADTIRVTGDGLAGAAVTFVAQAAPPARLKFVVQPTSTPFGSLIAPAVQVEVRDTFSTAVTSATTSVRLALVSGTGATLQGDTVRTVSAGVATFANLTLNRIGSGYRLVATAAGLVPDTSSAFRLSAGAPDHLAFLVQPSNVVVDAAIAPAIQVAVQDAGNNTVDTAADVTLTLFTVAAPGAQAYGTLTAVAANGVATFSGVKLNKAGIGYTLRASTPLPGVRSAESQAFAVTGPPATIALVSGNNQNNLAGATLAPFVVRVTDAGGSPVTGDSVVFKVTAGGGKFGGQDSAVVLTDAAGQASAALTLGPATGTNSATAVSKAIGAGSTVTFAASATAADVHLAFVVQPSSVAAGTPISPAIQVAVQDNTNATVTSASTIVTLAIASGTGTTGAILGGTVQVAAVSGVATFSTVTVDKIGTGYRLAASAYPATAATSAAFDVTAGAASRLVFTAPPASGTAGASLGSIAVAVADAGGNVITSATNSITLALAGGTPGAHLRGTATRSAVAGVATFTGLSVDSTGTGYTLAATATGLSGAASGAFAIQPAPASRLAFSVQPSGVTAGVAMSPAVVVLVQDSLGNTVTVASTAVTLAIGANPGGATLGGTGSVTANAGVATFSNLRLNRTGAGYTLTAGASGLVGATSSGFTVTAAPAAALAFVVSPTDALTAATIAPAVTVAVVDSLGNRVTSAANSITLDITSGTGTAGATLAGTTTVSAASGLATFSTLSIATAGNGYTMTATATGLAQAVSAAFNILTPTSNRYVFTTQPPTGPSSAVAGNAMAAVVVTVKDGSNNTVTSFTDSVTVILTPGTGTPGAAFRPGATTRVKAVAGVATFSNLRVDSAGTGYTLTASGGTPASGTSAAFSIIAGPPERLVFLVQPSSRTAGNVFSPAIQLAVLDSVGNRVTSVCCHNMVLAITSGTGAAGAVLAGTTTTQAYVNGVATFDNLSIAKAGVGYTLTATYAGMYPTASVSFSILAGPLARVSPAGVSISNLTHTEQFTAQDSLGNTVDGVTWTSLNPNVATVDPSMGIVTGLGAGQATIAATSGAATAYGLATVSASVSTPNLFASQTVEPSLLHAAWGTSPSDVFAVGEGGTILHWDGTSWARQTSGTTAALYSVWGASSSDVIVGGDHVILRYNGTTWSAQPSSEPLTSIMGVWTGAPNGGVAVGTGGIIWRYDGTTWQVEQRGSPAAIPVWGSSPSDIYAGGINGTILHYDGASWATQVSGLNGSTNQVRRIWGAGADTVFATLQDGTFARRTSGSEWAAVGSAVPYWVGLSGASSTNVVGVRGEGGPGIGLWNGSAWTDLPQGAPPGGGNAAWVAPAGDFFVVGNGITRGYRGATVAVTPTTPTLTALGATQQLTATARDASGNLVAGTIAYTWSSSDPTKVSVDPATGVVTAVANGQATITATAPGGASGSTVVTVSQMAKTVAVSPAGAWVSGVNSTTTLSVTARDSLGHDIASPTVTWGSLNPSVATVSPTGVVTAVASGQVTISATANEVTSYGLVTVAVPGATPVNLWAAVASGTTDQLWSVWGSSGSSAFVGSRGGIYRFDGTTLTLSCSSSQCGGFRVWGTSSSDVFAVDGADISHFDGAAWSRTGTSTEGLLGIWGTSPRDVYAVGVGGVILRFDGTAWTPMASGTSMDLRAIWGSSASDIWAVGLGGVIRHYDGTHWSSVTSPTTGGLYATWGFSGGEVYASGTTDAVKYDGSSWSTLGAWGALGMWGSSSSDLYALSISTFGTIFRYDGTSVAATTLAMGNKWLMGVWGTSASDVYAVGDSGTVLRGIRGATVAVTPVTPTLTALGATQQLTATARDASGNLVAGTIAYTWSSSDPTKVSVDPATGVVTAVANGQATITATAPGGASDSTTVTVVSGPLADAGRISAGNFFSCALTVSGGAYCWGLNQYGQLGNGEGNDGWVRGFTPPVAVVGGLAFQAISAGFRHTCGLTTLGAAYCWGENDYGQLGDGTTNPHNSPVAVLGGHTFRSLSVGSSNTCGLTTGGTAYCWGDNFYGQLGDGTTVNIRTTPVQVSGGLTFQMLSVGWHACGLTADGSAYCWGGNSYGELGDSSTTNRASPVRVVGSLSFEAISAGHYHTCAVTTGGAAYCWGRNSSGQVGDGTKTDRLSPAAAAGGLTLQALTAGYAHTCGLTAVGSAYCWGANFTGQLGDGTQDEHTSPVAVTGDLTFRALSASANYHTCGLTTLGAAYCWGDNGYGQLGDGTTVPFWEHPVPVVGGLTFLTPPSARLTSSSGAMPGLHR